MTTPLDTKAARAICEAATCLACGGDGQRAYGDTTCGRGGAGGQMVTTAACRDCRGLGVARPFIAAARTGWEEALDRVGALEAEKVGNAARWLAHVATLTADRDSLAAQLAAAVGERDRLAEDLAVATRSLHVSGLNFDNIERKWATAVAFGAVIETERDAALAKVDQLYASIEASDAHKEKLARMECERELTTLRAALAEQVAAGEEMRKVTGSTSDGYHTFDELYDHRITLFLALCAEVDARTPTGHVWRSKLHSDGSSFDGWFIMGIGTDPGSQISYHLPLSRWADSEFLGTEHERAPNFDGHTSADVLMRLRRFIA